MAAGADTRTLEPMDAFISLVGHDLTLVVAAVLGLALTSVAILRDLATPRSETVDQIAFAAT